MVTAELQARRSTEERRDLAAGVVAGLDADGLRRYAQLLTEFLLANADALTGFSERPTPAGAFVADLLLGDLWRVARFAHGAPWGSP